MYDEYQEFIGIPPEEVEEFTTPIDVNFIDEEINEFIPTNLADIPGVNIEEGNIETNFDIGEEVLSTPPKEEIIEEDLPFSNNEVKTKDKERKDNYKTILLKDKNIDNLFVGLNNISFSIKDVNEGIKASAYANKPYYNEDEVKEVIKQTLSGIIKKSYEINSLDINKKIDIMLKPIDNNPQLEAIMKEMGYDTSYSILSYNIDTIRNIAQKISEEFENKKVEKVLYDFINEVVIAKENLIQTSLKEYKPFYGKYEKEIGDRRFYKDELLFIPKEDYDLLVKNKNYDLRFRQNSYKIIDLNTDSEIKNVEVINKSLDEYKKDMVDGLDTQTKDKYNSLLQWGKLVKDTPIIVNNEYLNSEDIKYATSLTIKKDKVEVNFVDAINDEEVFLDEHLHDMLYKALEERYFDEKQRAYLFNKYKKIFTANGLTTMEFFDKKLSEIRSSEYLLKNSVDNELINIANYYGLLSESEKELLMELKKDILDTNEELYILLETYVKDGSNVVKELKLKEEATFEIATNIRSIHDELSESNDKDYISKERVKTLAGEFGVSSEFIGELLKKEDNEELSKKLEEILNSSSVTAYENLQKKLSKIDYREKFVKSFHTFSDTPYVLYADRLKEIFSKYNQIQVKLGKKGEQENELLNLPPEEKAYVEEVKRRFKLGEKNALAQEFEVNGITNAFFDLNKIKESFINEYKNKFNIGVVNIEATPQFKQFIEEKLKELEEFIGESENKLGVFEEKLNKAKFSISLKNADDKIEIEDKKKVLRGEVNDYFSISNVLTDEVIQNLEIDEEKKEELEELHKRVEILRVEKRNFSLEKIDEIEELFEGAKNIKKEAFEKGMKNKANLIALPIFSATEDRMVNLFIQEKELNPLYEHFKEIEYGDKRGLLKLLNNKNAKMIEIDNKSVAIEVDNKSFVISLPSKKEIDIKEKENAYINFENFKQLLIQNDAALEKFLKEKEQYKTAINRHIEEQLRGLEKPDPLISNEGIFSLVSFFSDTKKLLNNTYIGLKAVANVSLFMRAHLHSPREQYKNAKAKFLDIQDKLIKDSKTLQKEIDEFYEFKSHSNEKELKIYLENRVKTSNLARYVFGIDNEDNDTIIMEKIKKTSNSQILEKVDEMNALLNSNKTLEIKDKEGKTHSIKSLNKTKKEFIKSIKRGEPSEKIDVKSLFNKAKDKAHYMYELTKNNYTSFEEYKEKRGLTTQTFTAMFANEVSLYDKELQTKYVIEPMSHLDEDKLLEAKELLLAIKFYQNKRDYSQANQLKNKFFYMFNTYKTVVENEEILKEIYENVEDDLVKYKIYDYEEFKQSLENNVRNDILDPIRQNLNKNLLKAELTEAEKVRMFQLLIKEIDKMEKIQLQTMRENTEHAITIQNIKKDVAELNKKPRYIDKLLNLDLMKQKKEKEEKIKVLVENIIENQQLSSQEKIQENQTEEIKENQEKDFLSL